MPNVTQSSLFFVILLDVLASQDQAGGDATVTIDQRKRQNQTLGFERDLTSFFLLLHIHFLQSGGWIQDSLSVDFISNFSIWITAVQIIPAQVNTPTAIKVLKQSRGPRTPRISGEERSSPGNRTGTADLAHALGVCSSN